MYCLLVLLAMGCRERYDSPVHSPETGYLVVDGVINSGPGAASLTLSRTTKFDNKNIVYETGAVVNVQGQDSSVYPLTDRGSGQYSIDNINLNTAIKYRLRITASDGKQYASDFAAVKNNPPIDSISWIQSAEGAQLYINTHDPQNNTHYYQWVYDETWQIHSSYLSFIKYKTVSTPLPGNPYAYSYTVVYRDSTTFSFDPDIIDCWQFNTPSSIFIGSTVALSEDRVYLPITLIPAASVKLGVLYSIHVKQYTWTQDGYQFLVNMKKNTESTGSIFDAQPSELKGNIHNVADATEPVIGYFNICPAQEKRIFIQNSQLPHWDYDPGCTEILVSSNSDSIAKALSLLPTTVVDQIPGGIVLFKAATPTCVDCTLSGTNKKPAYWP
jgi:hypothetical protein